LVVVVFVNIHISKVRRRQRQRRGSLVAPPVYILHHGQRIASRRAKNAVLLLIRLAAGYQVARVGRSNRLRDRGKRLWRRETRLFANVCLRQLVCKVFL
jgi:hypothetical protein